MIIGMILLLLLLLLLLVVVVVVVIHITIIIVIILMMIIIIMMLSMSRAVSSSQRLSADQSLGAWRIAGLCSYGAVISFLESLRDVDFLVFCVVGLVCCISGNLLGTPHMFTPPSTTLKAQERAPLSRSDSGKPAALKCPYIIILSIITIITTIIIIIIIIISIIVTIIVLSASLRRAGALRTYELMMRGPLFI